MTNALFYDNLHKYYDTPSSYVIMLQLTKWCTHKKKNKSYKNREYKLK